MLSINQLSDHFFSTLKPAAMFEHEYVKNFKDKRRKLLGFSYHQSEKKLSQKWSKSFLFNVDAAVSKYNKL